jgi:hypothetical protein
MEMELGLMKIFKFTINNEHSATQSARLVAMGIRWGNSDNIYTRNYICNNTGRDRSNANFFNIWFTVNAASHAPRRV